MAKSYYLAVNKFTNKAFISYRINADAHDGYRIVMLENKVGELIFRLCNIKTHIWKEIG